MARGLNERVPTLGATARGTSRSYRVAYRRQPVVERLERLGRYTLTLVDDPEQQVLGADLAVVQETRLLLREDDNAASPVGELLEHTARLRLDLCLSGGGRATSSGIGTESCVPGFTLTYVTVPTHTGPPSTDAV